jgi:PIN domain nuclease of toxin-antitoxin system
MTSTRRSTTSRLTAERADFRFAVRLLLDTHAFLWWTLDHPQLSPLAREAIGEASNDCYFSAASAWELAIKCSLGKLTVEGGIERFVRQQLALHRFRLLPVALDHSLRVAALPWHHRDPFDRLLVAQAQAEGLTLLSADAALRPYDVAQLW